MKKYITIAALLAAGTAFANAETEVVSLVTSGPSVFTPDLKDGTTNITLGGWDKDNSQVLFPSAPHVKEHLGDQIGWVLGCGTMNKALPEAAASETTYFRNTASYNDTTGAGFTLYGRPAYRGVYTALILNVEDLLGTGTALTSLSLSFDVSGATAGSFSAWAIDGTEAEKLGDTLSLASTAATSVNKTLSVEKLNLTNGKIALLFNTENQGGGSPITVSKFKGTAIVIPEPSAFGLLAGLGALALVGTRRRRK